MQLRALRLYRGDLLLQVEDSGLERARVLVQILHARARLVRLRVRVRVRVRGRGRNRGKGRGG